MIPQQLSQIKQGTLGNDAGWALTFHHEAAGAAAHVPFLSIDSSKYYASIEATLPEGLNPGAYKITVEQFTDDHFALLTSGEQKVVVQLYLFWRDANTTAGAYFTNLIGVNAAPRLDDSCRVAELRLKGTSRRAGERGYDTELTLEEQAYALLRGRISETALSATGLATALEAIRTRSHASIRAHEANPDGTMTHAQGEAGGSEEVSFAVGTRYLAAVDAIANAVQLGRNAYGRGMVLIRDGMVHVGKRPIPFTGPAEVKPLTLETGLLHSEKSGEVETDPYADTGASATTPTTRAVWTLTLKGRADLKPGDVVQFEPPDEGKSALPSIGGAIAGAFAAPFLPSLGTLTAAAKFAYVRSVRHNQSRTKGFVTVIEGVVIAGIGPQDTWDVWRDATPAAPPAGTTSATPAEAAAEAVRRVARATRLDTRILEVGEVRTTTTNASGAVEPPAQTQTVWEGLARPDGRPNGVRRLPVRTDGPTPVPGVAYLTPFAWGGCGLILPRYPGTRVALGFRNGATDDPVQLGALWPSGHAPISEPGDWWLMLPVEVSKRDSVSETETVGDHTGKVVHDLTDGDGNRVIEVGELTVRVGRSTLQDRSKRPERPDAHDNVTIEHTGGAKLVLKQNGDVEITGKNITMDAGTGKITMKADTVDVQVTSKMEVH